MAQGQEAWAVVGQVHLCKAGCSHNFGIIFVTWYQGVTHKCRASDKRVANANCNEPCGTRCYFFSTFWYFLLRLVVEQVHLCRTGGDWCVGGWGGCIGACAQCAAPKLVGGGWQSQSQPTCPQRWSLACPKLPSSFSPGVTFIHHASLCESFSGAPSQQGPHQKEGSAVPICSSAFALPW